ncbi:MAG: fatty acid desaturase, partial [Chloroflexota bacterium]
MSDPQREPIAQAKIHWYRVPIDRALLAELNKRSDAWGLAQTLGHLSVILATGALSWYAALHWSWYVLAGCLFLHGTVYAFLVNAFHELCHSTVFRTRWLNRFFLYLVSFLGGLNHVYFWASHQEHHKYTLHQPDDMEVILPVEITLKSFLTTAFVNPLGLLARCKSWILLSSGRLENDWQRILFPESKPARRRELFTWARILLAGHTLIVVQAVFTGWWMLPALITLAPFYGSMLFFLCNNTQHVGLQDEVADFRLCTRTIY